MKMYVLVRGPLHTEFSFFKSKVVLNKCMYLLVRRTVSSLITHFRTIKFSCAQALTFIIFRVLKTKRIAHISILFLIDQSYGSIQSTCHMKAFNLPVIWKHSTYQSYESIQPTSHMEAFNLPVI